MRLQMGLEWCCCSPARRTGIPQHAPGIGTLGTVRRAGLTGRTAHLTSRLITGRVGYVRATSVNPAAENIDTVPVNTADPPTREALSAATSTG